MAWKGKKRAATLPPSPDQVRNAVNDARAKRLKKESAPTSPSCASRLASRAHPQNADARSRSSAVSRGKEEEQENQDDGGGDEELARDGRVDVLLRRPLTAKDAEEAIQSLVADSFGKENSTVYPQPGRAFLERLIQHLRSCTPDEERATALDSRIRQQWRRRLASFLAETVTKEDEVQDVAAAFGENIHLDHPNHDFPAHVKPPDIRALLAHLAGVDSAALSRPQRDIAPHGNRSKPLTARGLRHASATFRLFVEQLRLLAYGVGTSKAMQALARGGNEQVFSQLSPDRQREWRRIARRIRRRRSPGSAGSAPWKLMRSQNVLELLDIDANVRPQISGGPKVKDTTSSPASNTFTSTSSTPLISHPTLTSSITKPLPTPATQRTPLTALASGPWLAGGGGHRAASATGSSTSFRQASTHKLQRPSALTVDALRHQPVRTAVLIQYQHQKCRADLSVLVISNRPDLAENHSTSLTLGEACESTFRQSSGSTFREVKRLSKDTVAVIFDKSACAKRAVGRLVDVDGAGFLAEVVLSHAPTLFVADLSALDAHEDEVKSPLAHALQGFEGIGFVVDASLACGEEGLPHHLVVRFNKPPSLQCFFVPLQAQNPASQDPASSHPAWAWFRPAAPKAACVVCDDRHEGRSCPLTRRVDMPSMYHSGKTR